MRDNHQAYGDQKNTPGFCPFRHVAYPKPSLDPREISLQVTDLGCPSQACQMWDVTAKACAFKVAALELRLIAQLAKDTTSTFLAILDELKP